MSLLKLEYRPAGIAGDLAYSLPTGSFQKFDPKLLELGPIFESDYNRTRTVLAAMFDLEGFTKFCDDHPDGLTPPFVKRFLEWLFKAIAEELTIPPEDGFNQEDWTLAYAPLPFFAKFTGDGVLLLWDTKFDKTFARYADQCNLNVAIENIVVGLRHVCGRYVGELRPELAGGPTYYHDAPVRLRCGIARGVVYPIGTDFVGSCINLAARLQHFAGMSFGVALQGLFERESSLVKEMQLCEKLARVRGIGADKLVAVPRDEFKRLVEAHRRGRDGKLKEFFPREAKRLDNEMRRGS